MCKKKICYHRYIFFAINWGCHWMVNEKLLMQIFSLKGNKDRIDFLSFNLVIHSVVHAWSSILNWKYYCCAILLHSLTCKCRSFLPEKSLLFITNLKAWETVVCSWMIKSLNLLIRLDEVWKFMQGAFPSTYLNVCLQVWVFLIYIHMWNVGKYIKLLKLLKRTLTIYKYIYIQNMTYLC